MFDLNYKFINGCFAFSNYCYYSDYTGTSETIARILQPYNIRVAHKLITTLRRLLTNVKDKDKLDRTDGEQYTRSNVVM